MNIDKDIRKKYNKENIGRDRSRSRSRDRELH